MSGDFNAAMLIGGLLLGSTVGILTGFFGAGGGFIVTPLLNMLIGLPMNMAVGTSACQVLGASVFSLMSHMDRRWLGLKVALWTGAGIPGGVWCGGWVVQYLKGAGAVQIWGRTLPLGDLVLLTVFVVFLGLTAGWLLVDTLVLSRAREDDEVRRGALAGVRIPPMIAFRTIPHGPFSGPVLILTGLMLGFLSGLLGIGGGVVIIPVLFYLVGQEIKASTRSSLMIVLVTGLCATVVHARAGNIEWRLAGCLITGALMGTRLGYKLQQRTTGPRLRRLFAFVVLAAMFLVAGRLVHLLVW